MFQPLYSATVFSLPFYFLGGQGSLEDIRYILRREGKSQYDAELAYVSACVAPGISQADSPVTCPQHHSLFLCVLGFLELLFVLLQGASTNILVMSWGKIISLSKGDEREGSAKPTTFSFGLFGLVFY